MSTSSRACSAGPVTERLGGWVAQARADTPLGPVTVAATARGLAGLWFDDQRHHPGPIAAPQDACDPFIAATVAALAAYWSRHGGTPFAVSLDLQGTPFQRAVWQALLQIPAGRTLSYAAVALQLGQPSAVRAVGAAVGRNPVSLLVPCHRVVGSGGALTGYAGGLWRKRALLAHEAPAPWPTAVDTDAGAA